MFSTVDVVPDVELGPVREREHAHALARARAGCSAGARARAAGAWDPTGPWRCAARRRAPWPAIAPRRGGRRRRPHRSCPACRPSSSDVVLSSEQHRCVPTANGWVPSSSASWLVWTIRRAPISAAYQSRNVDHLLELVAGVDVQQRERDRARIERLLRQPEQDRRVLADRVEHHRPLELGDDLAQDVDALGFERAQVVEPRRRHDVAARRRPRPRRRRAAARRARSRTSERS